MRQKLGPQVATGVMSCVRCRFSIEPGEIWVLDHAEKGSYRGPAHASCNRRAGSEKVNGRVPGRRVPTGQPEGPPDEPIEDPDGHGWWGPMNDKGQRSRWSRKW